MPNASRSNIKTVLTLILSFAVLSVQTVWPHNLQRQSALDTLSSLRGFESAQSGNIASQGANHAARTRISEVYGKLPLSFEANQGQAGDDTKFISRGLGYELFLKQTEAVLSLSRSSKRTAGNPSIRDGNPDSSAFREERSLLRMQIVNANPTTQVVGLSELPGTVNYFVGNERAAWRTNIPTYSQVRYSNVYPSIDLVYYGNHRQLEYDFEVAPGGSPGDIKLSFQGANHLKINRQGDLVLTTSLGDVILHKPVAYQEENGERREVESRYVLTNKNQVSFQVGAYDRSRKLVIDPTLVYSTYLGGNDYDEGDAITVDAAGNAYIAGETHSSDFPTNGIQSTPDSAGNAFVVKLNSAGSAILYATFFGGSRSDTARAIAVDSAGNGYVTGSTASSNFPTVNALQSVHTGIGSDAFVAKLNPTGSALIYSTYIGGSSIDGGNAIAVDNSGNVYIDGGTRSQNFPLANPIQGALAGSPVLKSTDSADHWTTANNGITATIINSLAIDPSNTSTIYAGAFDTGLFKSINAGGSWSAVGTSQLSGSVNRLAIDRLNPSTIYAATNSFLFKSTDGGNSWGQLSLSRNPLSIAVDPSNGNTLYVGASDTVFKSTDGGAHFSTSILLGLVKALAINPSNTSIILAATDRGVYRSPDGSTNWVKTLGGFIVYDVAIDPNNTANVYAGTNNGVFKSTDGGLSWNRSNTGMPFYQINRIKIDPTNSNTLYVATNSAGVYKSINGGASWSASSVGLNSHMVNDLAIDPTDPAKIYVGVDGGSDAFVLKLNPAGSALLYSTYMGGPDVDSALDIAIDSSGNAHIVGNTSSTGFPTANALQPNSKGGEEAFVAKLNSAGSSLLYSTYLGGSGDDSGTGIALDSSGSVYLTGYTYSTDFPTASPFQATCGACDVSSDAFVTKLSSGGSSVIYSTYLGGSLDDVGLGIAVDSNQNAYVTGRTSSTNFPVVNAIQSANGGFDDVFVTKLTPSGSALSYSTYLGGNDSDAGLAIAVDANNNAYIAGSTLSANYPVAAPLQPQAKAFGDAFVSKISSPSDVVRNIEFSSAAYNVSEGEDYATINVIRTGDMSGSATVSYATGDGTAHQSSDYTTATGMLTFAPGETNKSFTVLIIDDAYVEGDETINLTLSNPVGATLGTPATSTLTIHSNDTQQPTNNPIDDAHYFVRQHYLDFLNREPDQDGWDYWTGQITQCGTDQNCINSRRVGVSAAYFIELEFQKTGSVIYRMYRASYGASTNDQLLANISYQQFSADRPLINPDPSQIQQSTQDFANQFVQRAQFKTIYPDTMTNTEFVNKLYDTAGLTPYTSERQAQITAMQGGKSRAQVLLDVIEIPEFKTREFNRAFVLMQYFGYLRRDVDTGGYDFWLDVLNNRLPNDSSGYRSMVCAFITSAEYQQRFSPVVTRNDHICGSVSQ